MTLKEKILYHQIHALKLAADIGCEPVSLYFFWRHELLIGLATHFLPPIVASALLLRYGDFEAQKNSPAGAHLKRHMTRAVEGIRLAGDLIVVAGAWLHHPGLMVLGLAVVIAAWCYVMLRSAT